MTFKIHLRTYKIVRELVSGTTLDQAIKVKGGCELSERWQKI